MLTSWPTSLPRSGSESNLMLANGSKLICPGLLCWNRGEWSCQDYILRFGRIVVAAPRSGLAWKHSIDVGAGVVDDDYQGPVWVLLFNHSDADFAVRPGDRVAQMVVERVATPEVSEVDDLKGTARGQGGFGSTGV